MNPGDRPRKALLATIGGLAAIAATAGLLVVIDTDPAAAGELERFASCEALAEWGAPEAPVDMGTGFDDDAGAAEGSGTGGSTGNDGAATADPGVGAPSAQAAPTVPSTVATTGDDEAPDLTSRESAPTEDGTNVIVEGVDELDVIDRLDSGHVLVSAAARLSIVDVVDHAVVANLPVGSSVQITYDRDNGIAWVVGPDDESGRLTVTRVAVTPTSLAVDASWTTDGALVDARRIGDRLHLVASDGYQMAMGAAVEDAATDAIPFASGPVPCDQVLHPIGESDSTATLLVTLPATGALEPEHATEVVGSGQLVHVTTDAAYLATPLYGETVQTGVHRFDLDDLQLTGSGRVDGSLLNQFSMSDHDGHLRLAVTAQGGAFGRGFEGDMAIPEPAPLPTDEGTTGTTGGDADPGIAPDVPTTVPVSPGPILNEVVVLDTDGALDVVGRTPRFGHAGETLQGVRFDGTVAYAVTYRQTDPFYVLDLSDPAAPKVDGEVELPGFSSYLHPIGEGLVAGFGPDDAGHIAVKLFDVSDRSQPRVIDSLELGEESPVAWDHHAFVDLGDGRFAVPATAYRQVQPAGCTPERQEVLRSEEARLSEELSTYYESGGDPSSDPRFVELQRQSEAIYAEGCLYPSSAPESSVVVVDTKGGELRLVQRLGAVRSAMGASRAVQTDDGWALLAGNHWVVLDGGSGDQIADLELGPEPVAYPTDGFGGGPVPGGTVIE